MVEFAEDLTVSLEQDRPGALAEVFAIVARANLNLEGYAFIEGLLHFLTRDASVARHSLEGAGIRVRRQRKVLVVDGENQVGKAAAILSRIAEIGINIHFSYVAAGDRVIIGAERLDDLADLQLDQATWSSPASASPHH
jgi:predicted amino acid-binding ACT domain protein